jgi:hypothetical protein
MLKLHDHVLARLRKVAQSDDDELIYPELEHRSVDFKYGRFYQHSTFRVNYTTYDVRRGSDLINPNSRHPDVMMQAEHDDSNPDAHPFWYARVLGVYHADVRDLAAPGFVYERMEFLHVRWFGEEPDWQAGWKARRLDRIGFVPSYAGAIYGFLDPARVLRGCHLMPAFSQGTTRHLLGASSLARLPKTIDPLLERSGPDMDWTNFYVNRLGDFCL